MPATTINKAALVLGFLASASGAAASPSRKSQLPAGDPAKAVPIASAASPAGVSPLTPNGVGPIPATPGLGSPAGEIGMGPAAAERAGAAPAEKIGVPAAASPASAGADSPSSEPNDKETAGSPEAAGKVLPPVFAERTSTGYDGARLLKDDAPAVPISKASEGGQRLSAAAYPTARREARLPPPSSSRSEAARTAAYSSILMAVTSAAMYAATRVSPDFRIPEVLFLLGALATALFVWASRAPREAKKRFQFTMLDLTKLIAFISLMLGFLINVPAHQPARLANRYLAMDYWIHAYDDFPPNSGPMRNFEDFGKAMRTIHYGIQGELLEFGYLQDGMAEHLNDKAEPATARDLKDLIARDPEAGIGMDEEEIALTADAHALFLTEILPYPERAWDVKGSYVRLLDEWNAKHDGAFARERRWTSLVMKAPLVLLADAAATLLLFLSGAFLLPAPRKKN